jgi:acetylornithine deacetylase/succinyl-diaminopimelate desuccinylase-like protein
MDIQSFEYMGIRIYFLPPSIHVTLFHYIHDSYRASPFPSSADASEKSNVLPFRARATVNVRLLPGDTVESAQEYITQVCHTNVRDQPIVL